jgi:hypothetical protein
MLLVQSLQIQKLHRVNAYDGEQMQDLRLVCALLEPPAG